MSKAVINPELSSLRQVAAQAVRKWPSMITRSVPAVEAMLRCLQQLVDPPLDLGPVLRRANLFRITPGAIAQTAQWLKANLQLSDHQLRYIATVNPALLTRSQVRKSCKASYNG